MILYQFFIYPVKTIICALLKLCSERKWKKINLLKIRNKKPDYLCMLLSFIRHELKVTRNLLDIAT